MGPVSLAKKKEAQLWSPVVGSSLCMADPASYDSSRIKHGLVPIIVALFALVICARLNRESVQVQESAAQIR